VFLDFFHHGSINWDVPDFLGFGCVLLTPKDRAPNANDARSIVLLSNVLYVETKQFPAARCSSTRRCKRGSLYLCSCLADDG
jgi:hypothetical protein